MRELSENEFDGAVAQGFTLVDFSAEWCGPCKALLPTITKLSTEYAGKVQFYGVDIDKTQSIALKCGVMSVPTLILFKQGQPVAAVFSTIAPNGAGPSPAISTTRTP